MLSRSFHSQAPAHSPTLAYPSVSWKNWIWVGAPSCVPMKSGVYLASSFLMRSLRSAQQPLGHGSFASVVRTLKLMTFMSTGTGTPASTDDVKSAMTRAEKSSMKVVLDILRLL